MLMSAAEVNRVADDFGRFQLPLLLFRRPYLGWTHGSWLLINGAVPTRNALFHKSPTDTVKAPGRPP